MVQNFQGSEQSLALESGVAKDSASESYDWVWSAESWGGGGEEQTAKLTINVPLFKELRDIIFFAGQSIYEPFQGTF